MASCMSSLTIHYFELNWKSFICSCSCGRSADPTACIQTRTWRRIRYLYKWFSGIQLLLWHYFFFFFPSWFLLHNFGCLQRNKEKHVLHPVLQQTLPGPLPLLGEAATSLLSLSKACMLHMPQDHLPLAHGDLQGNWFSFSAHPWGFPLVWLVPLKEGKQALAYCAAVALMC